MAKKVAMKVKKTAEVKKAAKPVKKAAVKAKPAAKTPRKAKYVYFFGGGKADGNGKMKALLGGKGAGLAEMTNAGVPVPPGFTITTEVCTLYNTTKGRLPKQIDIDMKNCIARMEKLMGKKFGDRKNPLLVSVRSGAKFSMPGMMDTVLNLGLNDGTVAGLAERTKNPRFAYDAYRRFIQMFGKVVMEIDSEHFEHAISKRKELRGVRQDTDLDASDWKLLVEEFKAIYKHHGKAFPEDPWQQLNASRDAVFRSWNNPRATTYRRLNDIPEDLGTAVNVQCMAFGNLGATSGTGVGFTRNPATGEKEFYGEYLLNAQGEDVVAGIRTPNPIMKLKDDMPGVFKQLRGITTMLEKHYKDVQDFEFTIEEGRLFMLQTRNGKRTGPAAVRIAVEMCKEKLISKKDAVLQVEPAALDQLLHPVFDPKERKKYAAVAKGLGASPGAASGRVVFEADDAVSMTQHGTKVVLVRMETSPDDIHGMHAAEGVLTSTGGTTSHAAVVGRQMGKPCVVGCGSIKVDARAKRFEVDGQIVKEGDFVSIDGGTGEVILAKVPTSPSEVVRVVEGVLKPSESRQYRDFATLLSWADEIRSLRIRANADIPKDSQMAIGFGAEGIGLCRTEHMFFAEERLPIMQKMILADSVDERRALLEKLLPMQRSDFIGVFEAMKGKPVTIRLLDPPLHEFLPRREELMVEIARLEITGGDEATLEKKRALLERVEELHEFNPMLGLRGCRLGLTLPEITEMQVRAIIEAACDMVKRRLKVQPEIMVPLTGLVNEMKRAKEIIKRVADQVLAEQKVKVPYLIGTMIEIPRAAVTADEIAAECDFFSFGTNDLTQMTFGYSRDDAGKFITHYLESGILEKDPFQTIDQTGVGRLITQAVGLGRGVRKDLKIGICGEHGGDPKSIDFCHRSGFNYVSCSPYRVPIARLAAARAKLLEAVSIVGD